MILEIILFTQLLKPIPEQPVFSPIETSLQLPLGLKEYTFTIQNNIFVLILTLAIMK